MKFLSKPTDSEGNTLATEKYVDKAVSSTSGGGNSAYAEFAARVACGDFPDGNMVIPDGITSIGDYAFCADTSNGGSHKYTLIKSITIPDSVTSIGNFAFNGCTSLTSITIPGSVTGIGREAFQNCISLESITIPDSVTSIEQSAFDGCTITRLIIAEGSETITSTIVICKSYLRSVFIPDSVTSIGNSAFSNCTKLISIIIGNGVTTIGENAFYYCSKLSHIYYTGTQEQWNAITKGANWNYYAGGASNYYTIHYNYVPK